MENYEKIQNELLDEIRSYQVDSSTLEEDDLTEENIDRLINEVTDLQIELIKH